jgi:hypothetical protein
MKNTSKPSKYFKEHFLISWWIQYYLLPKEYLPSLKNIGSHYRGAGGDALNLLEY